VTKLLNPLSLVCCTLAAAVLALFVGAGIGFVDDTLGTAIVVWGIRGLIAGFGAFVLLLMFMMGGSLSR
jgi:hypothetical protein